MLSEFLDSSLYTQSVGLFPSWLYSVLVKEKIRAEIAIKRAHRIKGDFSPTDKAYPTRRGIATKEMSMTE